MNPARKLSAAGFCSVGFCRSSSQSYLRLPRELSAVHARRCESLETNVTPGRSISLVRVAIVCIIRSLPKHRVYSWSYSHSQAEVGRWCFAVTWCQVGSRSRSTRLLQLQVQLRASDHYRH